MSPSGLQPVKTARRVNDAQAERVLAAVSDALGGLADAPVLVLGLTYREGVKELAYYVALRVIAALAAADADVHAHDPLLSDGEVALLGARPWQWGQPGRFRVIIVQTADRGS